MSEESMRQGPMRERRVTIDGGELAVVEYGRPPGPSTPSVLLVHGYPDDHRVFLPLIRLLEAEHHIVTYDTRNAGESRTTSNARANFRLPLLVDDLFAAHAAALPDGGRAHVLGHDWGSIQGWAALQDSRASSRIASFTSVSGPDLGHFSRWIRRRLPRPRQWAELLGQLGRSWYVAAFQLPWLPEIVWRFLGPRIEQRIRRPITDNAVRGLALYRANMFSRAPRSLSGRVGALPVQVVVPRSDPFLSPRLADGLQSWVPLLSVVEVDAGHWWVATHAAECAELLRQWVRRASSG